MQAKEETMPVTDETFERLVLEDPERQWELHCGHLQEKPAMTFGHNETTVLLSAQLLAQIDLGRFVVRINHGHIRRPGRSYYIPDIFVVRRERTIPTDEREDSLEVYNLPALLVVEVWSPSTGGYDVDTKFPEYRARGDLEIWRIHPYKRTLTAWRRRTDGTYDETILTGGTIQPLAVPGVTVDLDALFAR
jgi:Uma2 family endonuclease